jgi:hypothetical protein
MGKRYYIYFLSFLNQIDFFPENKTTSEIMSIRKIFLTLTALLLFFFNLTFFPKAEGISVQATRCETPPRIDGVLSDQAWNQAEFFTDFRMVEPTPGAHPSEGTKLLIIYDEQNLYIGVYCYDSEPEKISANSLAHDQAGSSRGMWGMGRPTVSTSDDVVRILIDPFLDKRTAYVFYVNARGARSEGLVSGGDASLNWDGIWEAKSKILDDGWSTEIKIPFKTISFNPDISSWGFNLERYIARKLETVRLSGFTRDSRFNSPMVAAELEGITGIKQGLGLTFRPYGLASADKEPNGGKGYHWETQGGFDLYKNFTPNLVGAFSYNTDFAETEVDERRINLTRFPLFFPEKRMFFLEGSETFNFSSSISFIPFFSRRIGLFQGNQVPIIFGTKLYGKVGRTNLAVMDVQTDAYDELPKSNFFAGRLTQDIFAESKIGLILTNGSPTGARNTLLGVDFNYSTSRFAGSKNLMLAAWMAYNWNDKEGKHQGFGFRADYPNDLIRVESTYAYYGEALDPGLGYMMRQGIQTFFLRASYNPRPTKGFLGELVRQFFFSTSGDFYWKLGGGLETSRITFEPLSFGTESGERVDVNLVINHDVLPYDFEVAEEVILKAGPYDFTHCRLGFNSASHRPLSLNLNYTMGGFYSGNYNDFNAGLTYRFRGNLDLSFDLNLVRGNLPEGEFQENVFQLKLDFYFSPDLGFMNYIQYDSVSKLLGWNARIRWEVTPGNFIYLVYNKSWERRWDPTSRFLPAGERGVFKITFSFRP